MPNPTADEVITLKHRRHHIQYGGARPGNPTRYAGQDAQYISVDGLTIPVGDISPIWVPDPRNAGKYRLVGRSIEAPDLITASLIFYEKHGALPKQLLGTNCPFNLYTVVGVCTDPSNFIQGWSDYVEVYSGMLVTERDAGTRSAFDSDDPIEDTLSVTLSDFYQAGQISFGEGAAAQVDREVVDVVYGSNESCGNCGKPDDGAQRIYAVTKSSGGSPGLPAELVYSTDGGSTWAQVNIDGFGTSEDPVAVDIAGSYLIVIGSAAYYWAEIDSITGVPGTFTKVTSGFVSGKAPKDLFVNGSSEVWFVGDGGYVYKSTDITTGVVVANDGSATTENLTRIHGNEDILVAVGNNGVVIRSTNRGITWAATTAPAGAGTGLSGVAVIDKLLHWVVSGTGLLFYTEDGGDTWSQKTFSGSGTGQIKDIVFATSEMGFFSYSNAAPTAQIFSTMNGGRDWSSSSPRTANLPVCDYINRLAYPRVSVSGIAANFLALGGLAGNGSDGIVVVGSANFV